jgi:hypothetical protein
MSQRGSRWLSMIVFFGLNAHLATAWCCPHFRCQSVGSVSTSRIAHADAIVLVFIASG